MADTDPVAECRGTNVHDDCRDEAAYCDCPWSRKGMRICKHILSARTFNAMGEIAKGIHPDEEDPGHAGPRKGTELSGSLPDRCTECLSTNYHKWGKRETGRKGKVQKYKCGDCGRQFTEMLRRTNSR